MPSVERPTNELECARSETVDTLTGSLADDDVSQSAATLNDEGSVGLASLLLATAGGWVSVDLGPTGIIDGAGRNANGSGDGSVRGRGGETSLPSQAGKRRGEGGGKGQQLSGDHGCDEV